MAAVRPASPSSPLAFGPMPPGRAISDGDGRDPVAVGADDLILAELLATPDGGTLTLTASAAREMHAAIEAIFTGIAWQAPRSCLL